jgi:DNA-directed RNA polymerase specialized sigma24 family protein
MADSSPNDSSRHPASHFATTVWQVVTQAGSAETTQAMVALDQLCRAYWHPLYCYVRRRGHAPNDAQDMVQGFFTEMIAANPFQKLSADKGRFRAFLLAAMNYFMSGDYDHRRAARRGGGAVTFSLDEPAAEKLYLQVPSIALSPEKEFDRRWALAVLERALNALASQYVSGGKQQLFEKLQPFLTDGTGRCDYSKVAAELKMAPNAVAVCVHRLRHRYQELVRAEVSATVAVVGDLEAEMRELIDAIRG